MAKKKQRSLLSMQREKLKRQKAAKAQKQASGKQLPPKGKSSAGSPRARVQRGLRRDAMAKKQLTDFGRALKKTLKQGAAQDKLNKAAKGTKGTGVRTGQAAPGKLAKRGSSAITKKGGLTKSKGSTATDGRIKKVRVRVDGQKQLRPGDTAKKVGSGSSRAAIKSGVKGALKAGAKGVGRRLGAAALAIEGVRTAKDLTDSLKRGEGYAALPGLNNKGNKGNKGRATKKGTSTKKRGLSSIPPSEGTGGKAETTLKYGAGKPKKSTSKASAPKPKSKAPVAASRPVSGGSKPKSTGKNPYRAPQGAERKDKSSKAVQELRGMIKASKARQNAQMPKKPAKKKTMSRNERNLRRRQGRL